MPFEKGGITTIKLVQHWEQLFTFKILCARIWRGETSSLKREHVFALQIRMATKGKKLATAVDNEQPREREKES